MSVPYCDCRGVLDAARRERIGRCAHACHTMRVGVSPFLLVGKVSIIVATSGLGAGIGIPTVRVATHLLSYSMVGFT